MGGEGGDGRVFIKNALAGGIASDKIQRRLGDISWSLKNGSFYIIKIMQQPFVMNQTMRL